MMYIVLCSHANQNNTCFPSYETLAREVGCCRNKAIAIISELEEMGFIKIKIDWVSVLIDMTNCTWIN